jgi:beta-glucanase (GH16 family)
MKTFRFVLSYTVTLFIFGGCASDNPGKITPTNLGLDAQVGVAGDGHVTFQALADNAVRYKFYFGEGPNIPVYSSDGHAAHNYLSSGTYNPQVIAYSKDSLTQGAMISLGVSVTNAPIPGAGYTTPDHYEGMALSWSDEFNGHDLNEGDWNYETGGDGWGNNELEYYQKQNTSVHDGYLIIEARQEIAGNRSYSSSRLTTQGKRAFKNGRIDIRALLPKGQGIWPALWMLGSSIQTQGWPKCGELDIMEMIGGSGRENTVYGTAHWDNAGSHASYGGHETLDGKIFSDEFHVFSIRWTPATITWFIDDIQYHIIDITPADLDELTKEAFFILNVAVGGDWPGGPDGTTVFPQRMVVDYIRVFQ